MENPNETSCPAQYLLAPWECGRVDAMIQASHRPLPLSPFHVSQAETCETLPVFEFSLWLPSYFLVSFLARPEQLLSALWRSARNTLEQSYFSESLRVPFTSEVVVVQSGIWTSGRPDHKALYWPRILSLFIESSLLLVNQHSKNY